MFIQTEATPNPTTLKFLPGCQVMAQGSANFDSRDAAASSPLASALFDVTGVSGVFLGSDFITITKQLETPWETLKPQILGTIMEHFTAGRPVINEDAADSHEAHNNEQDDEGVVLQIKELLDTRVRPAVAQDGGDITFHKYQDGIVYLTMRGACAGCPSSTATLKHGIENMLRYYIPEVQEVRAAE